MTGVYNPKTLSSTRRRSIRVAPIVKDSRLLPPVGVSGPCLSSSVAGRPLRPATRRRLGGPLPRQLADRPRTNREVTGLAVPVFDLVITCGINPSFPGLSPASRNVSTCYAPVRH